MIVEGLVDLFYTLILQAFSGLEIIKVPYELIATLQTITVYGVWVVGADIIVIFTSMVVGWWIIKFIVGLIVWVWELLPLT